MNRLARVAGVVSFLLYLSSGTAGFAMPVDLTVMTQNVYIGADGAPVLASPSPETIAAALASIAANNFPARAGAIAKEAADAGGPLLIGLQEADIIGTPTGTLNYTQILLDQLAARGLNYVKRGLIQALTSLRTGSA